MADSLTIVKKARKGAAIELRAYDVLKSTRFYDGIDVSRICDDVISITRCVPLTQQDKLVKYRFLLVRLVEELHAKGILHNDIEPSHLFWNSTNWYPFVVDFSESQGLGFVGKKLEQVNTSYAPLEVVSGGPTAILDDFEMMLGSIVEIESGISDANKMRKKPVKPLVAHIRRISAACRSQHWWIGIPYLASLIWPRDFKLDRTHELPSDVRYLRGMYSIIDKHIESVLTPAMDAWPWAAKHLSFVSPFVVVEDQIKEPARNPEGPRLFAGVYDAGRQQGMVHFLTEIEPNIRSNERVRHLVGRLVIVETCEGIRDVQDMGQRLVRMLPKGSRPLTVLGLVEHCFVVCSRIIRGECCEVHRRRLLVDRCRKDLLGKESKYYQTVTHIIDFAEECIRVGTPHLALLALAGRVTLVFDKRQPPLFTGPSADYVADVAGAADVRFWDKGTMDTIFHADQVRRAASEDNLLKKSQIEALRQARKTELELEVEHTLQAEFDHEEVDVDALRKAASVRRRQKHERQESMTASSSCTSAMISRDGRDGSCSTPGETVCGGALMAEGLHKMRVRCV